MLIDTLQIKPKLQRRKNLFEKKKIDMYVFFVIRQVLHTLNEFVFILK